MATAIVTLMSVAFLIMGISSMAQGSFKSVTVLSDAWTQMEDISEEQSRTRIEVIETSHSPPTVDVTVKNAGSKSLEDFSAWDVLSEYYDAGGVYYTTSLTYTTAASPGDDEWTVTGIYLDASGSVAEVFQPNVFNPEEEMVVRLKLSPAARTSSQNLLVIGTPNGVSVSTMY